jgi:hypothetical protein
LVPLTVKLCPSLAILVQIGVGAGIGVGVGVGAGAGAGDAPVVIFIEPLVIVPIVFPSKSIVT